MQKSRMASLVALACLSLSLSGCATLATHADGTPPTAAEKVMQAARATCAAWPIADAAFRGLTGSGLVKLPADALTWEKGVATVVKTSCDQVAAADAAGKALDLSTLNGILILVSNDIMAVTDYVASLQKT